MNRYMAFVVFSCVSFASATAGDAPQGPSKDVPELRVLNHWVGKWDDDVTVKPNKKDDTLAIEIALPDGTQFSSEIKVNPDAVINEDEEQEIAVKFVACPVALPGDPELIWVLGKRESMNTDEAGIALAKVEEEFWASKAGQKLLRDRVERSFPEFITRVPAGMLTELGLKRHYKLPEALKVLRPLEPSAAPGKAKAAAKKG